MQAIFLDLDGTLIDPKVGITASIQYALRELNAEVPDADDLTWCIGPPLWGSFEVLLGPGADLDEAVALYRERFSTEGLFEAEIYDGVGEMLSGLRETGAGLWLATSKPHAFANRIVEHFGLAAWLDGVFGTEMDGRNANKTALLAHALDQTGAAAEDSLMLGDRRFDIEGARMNGIPAMGALWGYADPEELHQAEPDALAAHPAEVPALLDDLTG